MSEVRILDIAATSVEEFRGYLQRYTGPTSRFLDPQIAASSDVKLSHRSQADIFRYCLNYVRNCTDYVEMSLNCQTFAADFYTLLSGTPTEPVSAHIKAFYKRHLEWLLCDP